MHGVLIGAVTPYTFRKIQECKRESADVRWQRRNVRWCNKKVWKCKGTMLLWWRSNTNITTSLLQLCTSAISHICTFATLLSHLPTFPIVHAILQFWIIALLIAKGFLNSFYINVKHMMSDHFLQLSYVEWKITLRILSFRPKGENAAVQVLPNGIP